MSDTQETVVYADGEFIIDSLNRLAAYEAPESVEYLAALEGLHEAAKAIVLYGDSSFVETSDYVPMFEKFTAAYDKVEALRGSK